VTRSLSLVFLLSYAFLHAQDADSSRSAPAPVNADDPSQFITRIEVYNELQYREQNDFYLNQSIARVIVKLGKRFTTRLDVPYVYNTIGAATQEQQAGIGDISLRLLGYQLFQRPRSALTASVELSFNTAESAFLGAGKNVVIPMLTYSFLMPKQKMLFSAWMQHASSYSGVESRQELQFTKLQLILIRYWSRKYWTVLSPEFYYDFVGNGLSMNARMRLTHAPSPRINLWMTPSVGVFGDFFARYSWSIDVGGRYFLFRGK
jgi:hypothetical protein